MKSANTNKKVSEDVMFPNRPKEGVTNRKRPAKTIEEQVEEEEKEELAKMDMT